MEKISIIVPIYNVAPYLPACLDSIIHQTYLNLEIILVDDGSTDSSNKICEQYKTVDPRIQPPGRAGYARANRQSGAACRLCRGSSKILFHSPQIVKAWGGVSKFIVSPLKFFKNISFVCSNPHFPLVIFNKQA